MKEVNALLLAAGLGSRLKPFTNQWPKCLMPIGGRPLLEYWLCSLYRSDVKRVIVNSHHHQIAVTQFLQRRQFDNWVIPVAEPTLLGTAGTLRENRILLRGDTVLLAHADNWCQLDYLFSNLLFNVF